MEKNYREIARKLSSSQVSDSYRLGTVLRVIKTIKMHKDWGYSNFKSYVEGELNFSSRKAGHLISICEWHDTLNGKCLGWARSVPWSKARHLKKIVNTKNWRKWKDLYDEKPFYKVELEIQKILGRATAPRLGNAPISEEHLILLNELCYNSDHSFSGKLTDIENMNSDTLNDLVRNSMIHLRSPDGYNITLTGQIILKVFELGGNVDWE